MVPTIVEHLHVVAGQPPRAGVPVLATAAVYVAVAGAGLLGAPVLTGLSTRFRARGPLIAAVLLTYAALVVALGATGQLTATRTAVALSLALVAATTLRLSSRTQLIGGAALAMGQVAAAYEGGATNTVAIVLHLVAAAIWIGGVAHLAVFGTSPNGRPRLGAAVRRFSRYAVGASLVLVGSGVLLLLVHRIGMGDLATSRFGNLVLVKSALLVLAAGLGLAHRSGRPWRAFAARRELLRVEAGVLASALAFGAVLAETALPQEALAFAAPGIAVVSVGGGQSVDLFVTRRGSVGVVRLLSDWSVQLVDRTTGRPQQLDPGQATRVQLREGVAELQLTSGDNQRAVDVPVAAPIAGESLEYQLGRAVALSGGGRGTTAACGSPDLTAAGSAFAQALRVHHVNRLAVVTDASEPASALLDGLTQGGVRFDQHSHSLLVATSVTRARVVLRRLTTKSSIAGIYLAPWLLDSRVLSLLPNLRLPSVTIAATADVMSPLADRYRAALSVVADGVGPSIDGLHGYESVAAPALQEQSLTLYAATPIGFLPGVLDVGHNHSGAADWFSSGTLVPVSAATAVQAPACHHPTA
jgi:putative copper export protein